ncbi:MULTISPECIES: thiolase family protein [Sphingobium]|jgi:acetyl-CoA acetyltransferase|uniref:thiolase family protein n=1 Tax=Sphingobium TaxID=165695 RepID=UPI000C6061D0|nr:MULTISPECIES: thiolase family protein [Sphingobium]MAX14492.1 acetyl-CoA acetyltransferase [Sphingobium sp.]MBS48574.1 acetyl-CoA acetyltransferase [Sphingobium sp.]MBS90612.1 acetyl-CoA acetyltransferase [Sphingobium sp.]MCC4256623.1 thiolase family protein [Sphingobium lactosutens]|tara:strand:- start:818 stop:1966 length:1149 start_codon:yes stop_codon:yes gene_type:complete
MSDDVFIVGAGIHSFGRTPGLSGLQQGVVAVRQALDRAGLAWPDIQFAFGGSDAAGNADTMVSELGLTGIPFINVANGCATGGSAMFGAYSTIKSGEFDLGLAVGFDKHPRGSFSPLPADWGLPDWYGETGLMLTTQFFAMKIQRYMSIYGITPHTLGAVAEKAFANGVLADHAWRREAVDIDTIMNSQMVSDPLTKFMFCSPGEGAVALLLASGKKARELGLPAVRLRAAAVRTRPPGSFEVFSPALDLERGGSPTSIASRAAYDMAGVGPEDIDIAQLQDTEVGAEIMHMAENGFCADGDQTEWIARGRTRIDGDLPVNTDGGCLACGEPIGASGLRQVYENYMQLTGQAGARQAPGKLRLGYSHVYGAPGVSAVAIVER